MKKQSIIKIIATALSCCIAVNFATVSAAAAEVTGHSQPGDSGVLDTAAPGVYDIPDLGGKKSDTALETTGSDPDEGFAKENVNDSRIYLENYRSKTVFLIDNGSSGKLYYTPASGENSALLKLVNVNAPDKTVYRDVSDKLNIEVVGVNTLNFIKNFAGITLTGDGTLSSHLFTERDCFSKDNFQGTLNAMVEEYYKNTEVSANVTKRYTIYGRYETDSYIGVGVNKTLYYTLNLTEGSALIVPESVKIMVYDNYTDHLTVDGIVMCNGTVDYQGTDPVASQDLINDLKVMGSGTVANGGETVPLGDFEYGGELTDGELIIDSSMEEKIFFTVGEGRIYYTPPTEEAVAVLKLENLSVNENCSPVFIGCPYDIPVILEAVGNNKASIEWLSYVMLTGEGNLDATILAVGDFEPYEFTGKLNAKVGVVYSLEDDPVLYEQDTIYGEYVESSGPDAVSVLAGLDIIKENINGQVYTTPVCTLFRVPEGSVYTVPEGTIVAFINLNNENYMDYLTIEGEFINNGAVVLANTEEQTPENTSELIESLNFSGNGFFLSTVYNPESDDNVSVGIENADIYDNNGFLKLSVDDFPGGKLDKITIDDTTPKFFCCPDDEGKGVVYYTPSEDGAPALLEVWDIHDSMLEIIEYNGSNPLTLKVKGENYLDIESFPATITITGEGFLQGGIMSSDYSVSDEFAGELNLLAIGGTLGENFIEYRITVYGEYILTDDSLFVGTIEENANYNNAWLTIPEGAKLVLDGNTLPLFNVGDNYGDYLIVEGELVNNGLILCYGEVPSDPSEFIRSLRLTGTGYVKVSTDSENNEFDLYNNNGEKFSDIAELDFTGGAASEGSLEEDGYHWDSEAYTLELKDFRITNGIYLPYDKPVTVNSSGSCYVAFIEFDGEEDLPENPGITFTGDGSLTVNDWFAVKYSGFEIVIAEGARLISNSGVSVPDGILRVYGSLTSSYGGNSAATAAVYAGSVIVGSKGVLNVSGEKGVLISPVSSYDCAFSVSEGGSFIADCKQYNLLKPIYNSTIESNPLSEVIQIPEGYLPHGYNIQAVKIYNVDAMSAAVILAEGTDLTEVMVFVDGVIGEGLGGSIIVHPHSADYNQLTPDPSNPERHIYSCVSDPEHTHSDGAAPHSYGEWQYASDSEHTGRHAKECEACGYAVYEDCAGGEATCVKGSLCEICGGEYTDPLGHDLSEWSTSGKGEHTGTCSRCDYTETAACTGGEATCVKGKLCETCGGEYTDPLGHDLSEWSSNGKGEHTRTCSRCDYTETEACVWGDWQQTKAPTETEPGLKVRSCTVCGGEESETVPALGSADPDKPDPDKPDPDKPDPDNPDPDKPDPDNPDPGNPDPDNPDPDNPDPDNPDPGNPDPDNPDPDNPDPDGSVTLTDKNTGISVSGAVPDGAELIVKIDNENSSETRLYFDIVFLKDGKECQPEGKVTVKIPVPEAMKDKTESLKVYHFAGKKYTDMNAKQESGYLVFETGHFSVYVVASEVISEDGDDSNTTEQAPVTKPDTGDFMIPEITTAADTTTVPQPDETSAPAETVMTNGESASAETSAAVTADGSAETERPISEVIFDNAAETPGNTSAETSEAVTGASGGSEHNPNTGLSMAVIPMFIGAASASLIIYNRKK